jgi:hypothetical protein
MIAPFVIKPKLTSCTAGLYTSASAQIDTAAVKHSCWQDGYTMDGLCCAPHQKICTNEAHLKLHNARVPGPAGLGRASRGLTAMHCVLHGVQAHCEHKPRTAQPERPQ